jgi:hypothetical protein
MDIEFVCPKCGVTKLGFITVPEDSTQEEIDKEIAKVQADVMCFECYMLNEAE